MALLSACDTPYDEGLVEELSAGAPSAADGFQDQRDGRPVVEHNDGTWSYADRWTNHDEIDDGTFVWAYVAKVRYPVDPKAAEKFSFVMDDEKPRPLAERMLGHRRYSHGEIWEIVDVHADHLDPELVKSAEADIQDFEAPDPREVGRTVEWFPESWTNEDCDGVGGNEVHVWDGESRTRKAGPGFTNRQETAVFLNAPFGIGQIGCSGVLLRNRWVLTAAHCVVDAQENLLVPESDWNVRNVHGETVGVDAIHVASGYNYTAIDHDYEDDWALLKLDSTHPTPAGGDMDIYGGSDSDFEDIDEKVHLLGYPSFVLSAAGNCIAGNEDLFHLKNAKATSTPAGRVRFKSDGAPQQSGAPYYFCPDGADDVCGAGEEGRVVAVHAGFNPVNNRYVGPKASSFRAEALSIMP
jgi:hypothetical protein